MGGRFTEALARDLLSGRYEPTRAVLVPVPKRTLATRPAALLTLRDRVVYDAVVGTLRQRINGGLVSRDVVYWPRGIATAKRWQEFNEAPATMEHTHVVLLDISGFYESIDHDTLEGALIDMTGRTHEVQALSGFLNRTMGGSRGLPQGLAASDPIASAYLDTVDRAMLRNGLDYFRNGDDIRISAVSYGAGVEAAASAEEELRKIGLHLNGQKSRILSAASYRRGLVHVEAAKSNLSRRIANIRIEQLLSGDRGPLIELFEREGLSDEYLDELDIEDLVQVVAELGRGRYAEVPFEEAIETVREHLTPGDEELACRLFAETVASLPGDDDGLPSEDFHERLYDSLMTLAAKNNPFAVEHAAELALRFPAETEVVTKYLGEVVETHARKVATEIDKIFSNRSFRHAWQDAWFYGLLIDRPELVTEGTIEVAEEAVNKEGPDWIRRVYAARVLGAANRLTRDQFVRLWRAAPPAYHTDLAASAVVVERQGSEWASAFVEGVQADRVIAVAIDHVRSSLDRVPQS